VGLPSLREILIPILAFSNDLYGDCYHLVGNAVFPLVNTRSTIETVKSLSTSTYAAVARYSLQQPPGRTLKRKLVDFLT
jgi:hypothetical protein